MKWTKDEEKFIEDYYEKYGLQYCSDNLKRSKSSIQRKAIRLKIKYKKNYFYMSEDFKILVKNSYTLTEICEKMNLVKSHGNRRTIKKYIKINDIDISHFYVVKNKITGKKFELNEILIEGSSYTSISHLKERLYKEGIKKRECELCGQDENWNNMKISLILDHIDGVNTNHKIENLRIICPNCNAGLETFSGKNSKKDTNNNFYTRQK